MFININMSSQKTASFSTPPDLNFNVIHTQLDPTYNPRIVLNIKKTAENQQWENDLFNDRNVINGNKLRTYKCFENRLVTEDYVKLKGPLGMRHFQCCKI